LLGIARKKLWKKAKEWPSEQRAKEWRSRASLGYNTKSLQVVVIVATIHHHHHHPHHPCGGKAKSQQPFGVAKKNTKNNTSKNVDSTRTISYPSTSTAAALVVIMTATTISDDSSSGDGIGKTETTRCDCGGDSKQLPTYN
jgi:hypothetical protein